MKNFEVPNEVPIYCSNEIVNGNHSKYLKIYIIFLFNENIYSIKYRTNCPR